MKWFSKRNEHRRSVKTDTNFSFEQLEPRELLSYSSGISGSLGTLVGDGADDVLRISQSAGFLRHNRFSAGDAGFASNFDFVTGDGNNETKLAAAIPTRLRILAGAGNDRIALANGMTFLDATIDGGAGIDTLDFSQFLTPTFTSTGDEALLISQLGPSAAAATAGRAVGGISGIMFNPTNNRFTIGIEVRGVALSAVIGAKLRLGPAGSGGPVVIGFGNSDYWAESQGVVTRTLVDAQLPPQFAADFLAGNIHLSIETSAFPAGEIQGQVLPSALPHSATGLAIGGLLAIENVVGGSATNGMIGGNESNHFVGGPAFDMLLGRRGDDLIEGRGAFDVLVGGAGADLIFGGDGDDRVVWNNGDGSDFIDGGSGFDVAVVNGSAQAGDAFEVSTTGNRQRIQRTNLQAITLIVANAEQLTFNTQGGDDSVLIRQTNTDLVVAVNGSLGDDYVVVDSNGWLPGGDVSGLQGPLIVDGGAGHNELFLEDRSDATGDRVTVSPTSINLGSGDNFFGTGGSVLYRRLQKVTLNMPDSIIGDTINLYPSAATEFEINGNGPRVPNPGQRDTLNLQLADTDHFHFASLGQGAGRWTFANAMPITFTGIEKRNIRRT